MQSLISSSPIVSNISPLANPWSMYLLYIVFSTFLVFFYILLSSPIAVKHWTFLTIMLLWNISGFTKIPHNLHHASDWKPFFIILDTYLNSSIAKNNNQQMLYTVFVSLMQTIKGKYIGKKATKNTDHRSYQSSKILKCTVSAFNAFLILKTHVIMTFFNVFCMNMFPLGVVFLEISRRCNDQSVVRMMTITKNSQLYSLVLWILDYGHHFDDWLIIGAPSRSIIHNA